MRILWVISCITALAGCSSDPIGHVKPAKPTSDDSTTSPRKPGSASADGSELTAEEVDVPPPEDDFGDIPPPPPPPGSPSPSSSSSSTPPPPKTSTPPPPPPPTGTACQASDTKEVEGKDTPMGPSACGTLSGSTDEDFFLFTLSSAKTINLSLAADADAVARLSTPNDGVLSVSAGGSASIPSSSGIALVRVKSRMGMSQAYRLTIR